MQTYQTKKDRMILTTNIVMIIVLNVVIILKCLICEMLIVSVIAMSSGCCLLCGHCTDEIIAEMMACKCRCHG
jgi:hypothetical protein